MCSLEFLNGTNSPCQFNSLLAILATAVLFLLRSLYCISIIDLLLVLFNQGIQVLLGRFGDFDVLLIVQVLSLDLPRVYRLGDTNVSALLHSRCP